MEPRSSILLSTNFVNNNFDRKDEKNLITTTKQSIQYKELLSYQVRFHHFIKFNVQDMNLMQLILKFFKINYVTFTMNILLIKKHSQSIKI